MCVWYLCLCSRWEKITPQSTFTPFMMHLLHIASIHFHFVLDIFSWKISWVRERKGGWILDKGKIESRLFESRNKKTFVFVWKEQYNFSTYITYTYCAVHSTNGFYVIRRLWDEAAEIFMKMWYLQYFHLFKPIYIVCLNLIFLSWRLGNAIKAEVSLRVIVRLPYVYFVWMNITAPWN